VTAPRPGRRVLAPRNAPSVRTPRLAAAVERILARVAAQVDDAIQATHPSAEDLHQLHRGFRRLRLGIELWVRVLPARDREVGLPLERRTKRLARLVGEVRDRDIVLALFEEVPGAGARPEETEEFHRFLARLRDDARTGRELLRASLRTERDAGLFVEIRSLLERTPSPRGASELRTLISGRAGLITRACAAPTGRPPGGRPPSGCTGCGSGCDSSGMPTS